MAKLSIFTLGYTGVVIDQNPLGPDIPQNALLSAQNAGPDPRVQRAGAVRKRPGLARFNIQWAGGVILGGIPMPVAGFGGAPASGGGAFPGTGDADTGASDGTGDMTGAPGATFDGGAASTTPPGASIFGGGSLFGGARLIVVARSTAARGDGGLGWYVSSKGLANTANLVTTPTQATVYQYPPNATFAYPYGKPGCIDTIGTTGLYYAGNTGDQIAGTGPPTVYRTDGATNALLATIPKNITAAASIDGATPNGTVRNAIVDMHYGYDGFIYICVKDKYTGQNVAGSIGRVFRMAPLTGALVEWNMGPTPGPAEVFTHIPYTSCYFDGKLYVGTFPDAINESAQVWATDGDSAVQETAFTGPAAHNYGFIASSCIYNGRLWMGLGEWATVPQFVSLVSRRPGVPLSAWDAGFTVSTAGAANGSSFISLVVFGDSLYAGFIEVGVVGRVYKITANNPGDPLSTSFTTSIVLNGLSYAPRLWVDDGVLYSISEGDSSAPPCHVTTDGTTWTDKSGTLPGTAGSVARGIFFGLDQ